MNKYIIKHFNNDIEGIVDLNLTNNALMSVTQLLFKSTGLNPDEPLYLYCSIVSDPICFIGVPNINVIDRDFTFYFPKYATKHLIQPQHITNITFTIKTRSGGVVTLPDGFDIVVSFE